MASTPADPCPCIGPSCGRQHRDGDPCHCPEIFDRGTWHNTIVPAAEEQAERAAERRAERAMEDRAGGFSE